MLIEDLKPMDFSGILKFTIRIVMLSLKSYLKIFGLFLLIELLFIIVLVGILFGTFAGMGININPKLNNLPFTMGDNNIFAIALLLIPAFLLFLFAAIVLSVFFNSMTFDLYIKTVINERWDLKSSFESVKRKFWTLFLAGLLSSALIIGGILLCCIGIIPMIALVCFVLPVVLFEDKKTLDSITRSFNLVKYSFWKILLSMLFMVVVILAVYGLIQILNLVITFLSPQVFSGKGSFINMVILGIVSMLFGVLMVIYSIFSNAIMAAFQISLFFSQKVKYESFGVNLNDNNDEDSLLEQERISGQMVIEEKKEEDDGNK